MKQLNEIQTELKQLYYVAVDLAWRLHHAELDVVQLHPDKFVIHETSLSEGAVLVAQVEQFIGEMYAYLKQID